MVSFLATLCVLFLTLDRSNGVGIGANLTTFSGVPCTGNGTASMIDTGAVNGCYTDQTTSVGFYCLANNMWATAVYTTNLMCNGAPALVTSTRIGTGCSNYDSRITSCNGTDAVPSAISSTAQYISVSGYSGSTCAAADLSISQSVPATFGTCVFGSVNYCDSSGSATTVSYQNYNCTGPMFQISVGIAGVCSNGTASILTSPGVTVRSNNGRCNKANSTATPPAPALTATAFGYQTYTDSSCTTQTGPTESSTAMCAHTDTGPNVYTKVTCTAAMGTVMTYAASGCSGTAASVMNMTAGSCVWSASDESYVKFWYCGSRPTTTTTAPTTSASNTTTQSSAPAKVSLYAGSILVAYVMGMIL